MPQIIEQGCGVKLVLLQDGESGFMAQLLHGFHPLQDGWCPLFARKFAPNARAKLRELARFYVSQLAAVEALPSNGDP